MFGFFGKKKKDKKEVAPVDRRRGQRRKAEDRRDEVRWEPQKEDRRKGERRNSSGHWGESEKLR